MLRWFGAGLILGGGLLARRELLETERRAQRDRRSLAASLEEMEAEIRLLLTPMPALLRARRAGDAEGFFTRAAWQLSRGAPLERAWREAASALPLGVEEREELAALGGRLAGGEEGVRAALLLAASRLRERYGAEERKRPQTERLTTALCVGMSLLLAILLA